MDIELLQNFQKLINQNFNEMVISQIEQYRDELEKLNQSLELTACLIKEKENLITDLQKQVDENKFEESNFTNVSIIQNLNNQIKDLSSKNELLETSLRLRREADKANSKSAEREEDPELEVVEAPDSAPESEPEVVEEEEVSGDGNGAAEAKVAQAGDDAEAAGSDAGEEDGQEEEVEVEVVEIEHEGKTYYVQNQEVFTKKKNGEMGKKVGEMDGTLVVITRKKEKRVKKDKDKDKKKKKKNSSE